MILTFLISAPAARRAAARGRPYRAVARALVLRTDVNSMSAASLGAISADVPMGEDTDAALALYEPTTRDATYVGNWAQYLVDLHDSRATFDFCGGMMFQLVLSEKLRGRLAEVAEAGVADRQQPVVFDARTTRMQGIPHYSRSADADNVEIFHGREIRQVKGAAGGMGFAIHLSDTDGDPEGWAPQEIADYNGWGHDSGRPWRDLEHWERDGVQNLKLRFGEAAFGLHHRFFLHLDGTNRFWLSAEDGCEGYACPASSRGEVGRF